MKPDQGPLSTARLALPRQCSRMLGRLLALPLAESLPAAGRVYDNAATPMERHLAMRLRLRLLAEGYARLQRAATEPAAEEEEITILEPEAEPEPEPEPAPELVDEPAPGPSAPKVKMMQMDLNSDLLSQMMADFDTDDDAED